MFFIWFIQHLIVILFCNQTSEALDNCNFVMITMKLKEI